MKKIQLTKGKEAIVDDHWYPILSKWNWYYNGQYAVRDLRSRENKETIFMHRYITMAPFGFQVDHINQNKLDNREENLRIVLPQKNYYNRSMLSNNKTGYKGVCFDKSRGKYMASISVNRKQINLGRFDTAIEAARAYDKAALELHGDYACINGV